MGLASWVASVWHRAAVIPADRNARRTLAKLRDRISILEASLNATERERDEWKAEAASHQRQKADGDEELRIMEIELRKANARNDVLQTQIDGQAKVIVWWEKRAERATARAVAEIVAAQKGLPGGMFDGERSPNRY